MKKTNEELVVIFEANLAKGGRLSPNCGEILLRIVGEQSARIDGLQDELAKAAEDGCCSADNAKGEKETLLAEHANALALAVGKIESLESQLAEAVAHQAPVED